MSTAARVLGGRYGRVVDEAFTPYIVAGLHHPHPTVRRLTVL